MACSTMTVSGNQFGSIPATVVFHVYADPAFTASPPVYRVFYGDGLQEDSASNVFVHQYTKENVYGAQGYVLDGQGNFSGTGSCHQVITVKIPVVTPTTVPYAYPSTTPYPTLTPYPYVTVTPYPYVTPLPTPYITPTVTRLVTQPQTGPETWLWLGTGITAMVGVGLKVLQKLKGG